MTKRPGHFLSATDFSRKEISHAEWKIQGKEF